MKREIHHHGIITIERPPTALTIEGFVNEVRQRREAILACFSIYDLSQEFKLPQEAAVIVTDYLDETLEKKILGEKPVDSKEGITSYYENAFKDHRLTYDKRFYNQSYAHSSTNEGYLRFMAKSLFEGYGAIQKDPKKEREIVEKTMQRCKDAAAIFLLNPQTLTQHQS